MGASISRQVFLSGSARSGAALVVAGAALADFTQVASAAVPSGDLAYARLLVGVELLAADFYSEAIAAANTGGALTESLRAALFNEQEHYQSVAGILEGAGFTPAVSADFSFSYPPATFASASSIVAFASQLEATMLGAYLGAVGATQTASLLQGLARIAACEAQHLSAFAVASGERAFRLSFPDPLPIDQVSNTLDTYSA